MVTAIIMGRKKSKGYPKKNITPVCGKSMGQRVIECAMKTCDDVYVTTDDSVLMWIADDCGAKVIKRPPELCTDTALGEDVYLHAFNSIPKDDYYALFMCSAPTVKPDFVNYGIMALSNNDRYDSACTVSKYNMHSPQRMRTIKDNVLVPFMPDGNCDRDSSGDYYIYDCSLAVVRRRCFENINEGVPPQRWLGKTIFPIMNNAGVDVDYEWQMGQVEWWLKNNGMV